MTEEEIGRWKSHYAEAKAALETLPSLIDDPVGHRESWQELSDPPVAVRIGGSVVPADAAATNRCTVSGMDRTHELELLRRSIAMQTPGTLVLHREEALRLLEELIELHRRASTG